MSIKSRIFALSAFLCLVIAVLSLFSINALHDIQSASLSVTSDSLPQLISAGKIETDLAQNQLRISRLLMAQTPEERQRIQQELAGISDSISKSITNYNTTRIDANDRAHLDKVLKARDAYLKEEARFLSVLSTNHEQALTLMTSNLRPAFEAYEKAGQDLAEYSYKDGEDCSKKLGTKAGSTLWFIGICTTLALLIAIAASVVNFRSILKAFNNVTSLLHESAQEITAASKEVAVASQSLAEGASEQAASIEETSASIEEMSSMSRQTADSAQEAKGIMQKDIATNLESTEQEMNRMFQALEANIAASEQTARIIKTIDEIAFQTNLLALNAAVEAARAGEAGLGFAVVADEVRNLAQRSAQAAKDTQQLISGALDKSKETKRIFDLIADLRSQNAKAASKISQFVHEVTTTSQQQSQGITQVSAAISQIDKVTQSNAAGAEESAAAAEEFHAQAEKLAESIQELFDLVGAAHASQPIHPEQATASQNQPEPKPQTKPVRRPAKVHTTVSVHETQDPLPMPNLEKASGSIKKLNSSTPTANDFKDF